MDPLTSTNVVLLMVTQYEKKIEVTTTLNPTEIRMACMVQANNTNIFKKDRPTCGHCDVIGHLKEKCFKLHGYPPGYKKTQSFKTANQSHNVSDHGVAGSKPLSEMLAMTPKNYQQLIHFLQTQMTKVGTSEVTPFVNSFIGHQAIQDDWQG
ncbi:unnamed protein product [Vicia faba]|uniref:Uncharacterized protein n=1 Tax=Vicia faba TaxID=3906 RepID=A0AAV0ZXQ0_VICFA|nr:unnamed protein product [Vicia faba]